jgi:hypothetical protein
LTQSNVAQVCAEVYSTAQRGAMQETQHSAGQGAAAPLIAAECSAAQVDAAERKAGVPPLGKGWPHTVTVSWLFQQQCGILGAPQGQYSTARSRAGRAAPLSAAQCSAAQGDAGNTASAERCKRRRGRHK